MKWNFGFKTEFPVSTSSKFDFCESELIPQVVKLKSIITIKLYGTIVLVFIILKCVV